MILDINTNEMINILMQDVYASWTREEAGALIEYYEELEEQMNEHLHFDSVAIRCDWASGTINEVFADYAGDEDCDNKLEWLQDRTQVIELDGSILYMDF